MSDKFSITYYDRKDGSLKKERVYAGRFLHWLYNERSGRWAGEIIFQKKFISWIYGWLHKQGWTRQKIKPFVKKTGVNLDELLQPLEEFSSFNEFFIREIDLSKRPINTDSNVCIAPADGKILVYPLVERNTTFPIKRNIFNLQKFLGNEALAEQFSGGSMVVSRLSFADYHHFHFPDSGIPFQATAIQGKYHAGGSYSLETFTPYYTNNHRMLTLFDSDNFGPMIIVEVGALTAGSIRQRFEAGVYIPRGARKGFFELGGSTIVLLFERGRIELDEDLLTNTKRGIETYVFFGDSIGRKRKAFSLGSKKEKGAFE